MRPSLLAGLLAVLAGCADRSWDDAGPNLVVITVDTLRADRLGAYGYFRNTTPELDALARESVVFENCYAPMATTYPSHLSLFTATYPNETGAVANVGAGGRAFDSTGYLRTMAQILREEGYRTAGFVSAAPLKRFSGISAGFEVFEQPEGLALYAENTTSRVFEWLQGKDAEGSFFLWVHYYDPHGPYAPPPSFAVKHETGPELEAYLRERGFAPASEERLETDVVNNRYDGEVSYVDHEIGRLLGVLKSEPDVWNDTIVVFLSDHGEGLRQHGELAHGGVWKEQLQVPLIMRIPGRESARVERVMSVVDTLPTLLGMVDLPGEERFLRQSSGLDRLSDTAGTELILSQESGAPWRVGPDDEGPSYVLTGDEWKYVYDSEDEGRLFRLTDDPYELEDVSADFPEIAEHLRATLHAQLVEQERRLALYQATVSSEDVEVDPEILEQLRSLGYVK